MDRNKLLEQYAEKIDAITYATTQALEILSQNAQTINSIIEEVLTGAEQSHLIDKYQLNSPDPDAPIKGDDKDDQFKFDNPVK
ncbi:hypothetical protein M3Y14_34525 (plasmid) [Bacillus thuringiensis]|uniref:hypothetical protein n=1 Tax=Bacillus thuringiensis TaxID=1428 RepID=UPI0022258D3A|nr:hypothetical protein [Bacillus thuringiensis]UYX56100.1 hypothetical protein M3Y14_34525 [Bacillus thuringiensis]